MNKADKAIIEEFERLFMDRGNYIYQVEIKDFLIKSLNSVRQARDKNGLNEKDRIRIAVIQERMKNSGNEKLIRQAEVKRLLGVIGKDEKKCGFYYDYGGKYDSNCRCGIRNKLRAELRSKLL